MKFIKATDVNGKEVIFNLSRVSHFYARSETQTVVIFSNDDFVTIDRHIGAFEIALEAMDDSCVVWPL